MLQKYPIKKPNKFLRGFIYFEIGALFASYMIWKRLNGSQDFRYKVKQKFPSILEGYYQIGESIGDIKTREYDIACWSSKQASDKTEQK
jgi:hypothetical protein